MEISLKISLRDVKAVRRLMKDKWDTPFLRRRFSRNCTDSKRPITRSEFWTAMCSSRLTTQQRSGPESRVSKLIRSQPFLLKYDSARHTPDPEKWIRGVLQGFGGIRMAPSIAHDLAQNLSYLEDGGWERTLDLCSILTRPVTAREERGVADHIDASFRGFGPKQARNILQSLGLTRYEIPIDSRVAKWLRVIEFPMPISPTLLSDRDYYVFILDAIQSLCERAGVLPCMFDAAVFSMGDGEQWTESNMYD